MSTIKTFNKRGVAIRQEKKKLLRRMHLCILTLAPPEASSLLKMYLRYWKKVEGERPEESREA